ncbi:glycosyltransferase family 1 protein [Brevundimonas sp. PAMC22021]|uniref:glycosyltransferase family 4 protein n=1 Tax=Brevundimonas sp. PAMC22021 TaxID=2861285 RepID=UPI001C6368EE|nr:glycosyltransferase family 1 protein [Brevundimonas sp. PAMC22021]QYF86425.1 glycosyltransferase family 4 protein [Brevundimonas sp. PAMC22021]
MTTLCLDGYNLAMPRGTGIATYGRSLLEAAGSLQLRREVLFGPQAPRSRSNIVNEANIVGAEGASLVRGPLQKLKRRFERHLGAFSVEAWPVEISGDVLWPERQGGAPHADGLWAAENVFHRAQRTFRRHGRALPVAFHSGGGRPRPDIMHWTTALPLHAPGVPNLYTVHDLIPLKAPHTTIHDREAFIKLHAFVAQRADHIVVVSEATRRDVIRLLGVSEDRVTNTYQAVASPDAYEARAEIDVMRELESTFDLGWKDYFIHFGAIEPKKNLGRVVEAFLASGSRRTLVIVGGRGWLQEDETALIAQVRKDAGSAADRIRTYDYMSQSHLVSLIRGARALLFPSLDEGFGLPVLEAMNLGTAVLTSNAGALPEVAGEAALRVEAEDVDAIRRGVQALDGDNDLSAELARLGIEQARQFSKEAYADRLRRLYARFS